METQLNNRIFLVFVLTRLQSTWPKGDAEVHTAIKMSCVVLSKQILAIKFKEQMVGTPIPDDTLFEKESFTTEELLTNIQKYYEEVEKNPCLKFADSEASFSHMSSVMLKGSINIIIERLKVDL